MRDDKVRLLHKGTQKYLYSAKKNMFQNPVPGQLEISAVPKANHFTLWAARVNFMCFLLLMFVGGNLLF